MSKHEAITKEWAKHFPLPPPGNMMEAHENRETVFVNQGTAMANALVECLSKHRPDRGVQSFKILDFGCGVGRLALPMFYTFRKPDVCVDVDPAAIKYLIGLIPDASPTIGSFEPPLPFADNKFDVIYAISVWTHLPLEIATRWLHEMRRILAPGGLALLTTSNYKVLEQRRSHPRLGPMGWSVITDDDLRREGFLFRQTPSTPGTGLYGMASHDPDWIRREWSKIMPVIGIESGAILGVQDINVLEKR